MARRATNKDRIDRLRAEKVAETKEKEELKKAPPKAKAKPKRKRSTARKKKEPVGPPVRMKVVWTVCRLAGEVVATFPYPQKAEAQAEAERLNRDKAGDHIVRAEKVLME